MGKHIEVDKVHDTGLKYQECDSDTIVSIDIPNWQKELVLAEKQRAAEFPEELKTWEADRNCQRFT